MASSDVLRERARKCLDRAEGACDEPTYNRFKRLAAAWMALAYEQDWLDGKVPPIPRMPDRPVRHGRLQ
jgi:hypothetical protein